MRRFHLKFYKRTSIWRQIHVFRIRNIQDYWVLDFVDRPVFYRTERFGNWTCYRPQVRGQGPNLLGFVQRLRLAFCNKFSTNRHKFLIIKPHTDDTKTYTTTINPPFLPSPYKQLIKYSTQAFRVYVSYTFYISCSTIISVLKYWHVCWI
jgi:hypothetical protein